MRYGLLMCVLLCFVGIAGAQNVSVTDYDVPVSRSTIFRVDVFKFNTALLSDSVTGLDGNVNVRYENFYRSLPFTAEILATASGDLNRDVQREKNLTGYSLNLVNARVRKYVTDEGNLFGEGKIEAKQEKPVGGKAFDQPESYLTLSVGYGRSIDATTLGKAVRIEDFLIKEGVIPGYLPKDVMLEVGHIIQRQDQYRTKYGDATYRRWWFEDMEKEIAKSGALKSGSVGAIGILRMNEVFEREATRSKRFYGWDVTGGVKFHLSKRFDTIPERDDPQATIGGRYWLPIGWKTQVQGAFTWGSVLNDNFGKDYTLTFNGEYRYELTNKIDFIGNGVLTANRSPIGLDKFETMTEGTAAATFAYYLENKIILSAPLTFSKIEGQDARTTFNVTLTYRIF